MTEGDALRVVRSATPDNVFVDADVLNFGGETKDSILATLQAARSCKGEDKTFVVDRIVTVLIDGLIFVIGVRR